MRIGLAVGLLGHKLFWEIMKRQKGAIKARSEPLPPSVGAIKLSKVGVFVFLLAQTLFLDVLPISEKALVLRLVGCLMFIGGLSIAMAGRWQLGDNWVDLEDYQVAPQQTIVASGIYRYIRHPIYAGDLLMLLGLQLALNSWLVLAVIIPTLVVVRQARAEEVLLSRVLTDYEAYRRRTKGFIPFVV